MYIFKKIADLQQHIATLRTKGLNIGFVPTMGALHQGHLSLIDFANNQCEISVCSIFVNPTQFDDKTDLAKYPRTISGDIDMLTKCGTDVLFLPAVEEVYPNGQNQPHGFDFGAMADHMEGAHRPGHFDGMAQVVKRLLEIVSPDKIFMGQKDYQQQALVKVMLRQMGGGCSLVRCPIVREEDGLAMSSRNRRLSPSDRKIACKISQSLFQAREEAANFSLEKVKERTLERLSIPGFDVDYLEFVDADTLMPMGDFKKGVSVVAITTVQLGLIRLLDNVILTK